MLKKEALTSIRGLVQELLRLRAQRNEPHLIVVKRETEVFLALFSTLDKTFLTDRDLGTIVRSVGVPIATIRERLNRAQSWFALYNAKAANNDISEREYESYTKYADINITAMANTLEKILENEKNPAGIPIWNRMGRYAAGLVLSIAGYTGLGMNMVYAQEGEPPKQEEKDEKKDYVKELEEKLKDVKIEEGKTAIWYSNKCSQLGREKQYDLAIRYGIQAFSLDHQANAVYTSLSTAYALKGDSLMTSGSKDAANQFYKKSLDLILTGIKLLDEKESSMDKDAFRELKSVHFSTLGFLYSKLGNKDEAVKYLEASLQLKPDLKGVREYLKKLQSQ